MNWLDYTVLLVALLGIPLYGLWRTRHPATLNQYLKGDDTIRWGTIGLSVMATQAGPITFLSLPGQAYENGIAFIQNYFGLPLALIVVCAVFVPIFHRLKVYTAYEYLGQRFDQKTRLLGASLFLIQRGLAAGITIYAPAIIISALLGWRLNVTVVCAGLVVLLYTMLGGTKVVSLTQRSQIGVIFAGMTLAFLVAVWKLPPDVSFTDALSLAGTMGKLEAVDFSADPNKRYTVWSGILGGFFLALSYFGTDQSQVGRYLAGENPNASKAGLLLNAGVKIPMQFGILLLGTLVFVFYQFEKPPVLFNRPAWNAAVSHGHADDLGAIQKDHDAVFARKRAAALELALATPEGTAAAKTRLRALEQEATALRQQAAAIVKKSEPNSQNKDSDFVFLTFIVDHLPPGAVGLLVAVIFSAAMSASAATLNALGSTTAIDFYRPLVDPEASDARLVFVARSLTAGWGILAIGFALFASLAENLIEAGNILGSLFYGSVLGLFLTAFFLKRVGGTAAFTAGVLAQVLVLGLYWTTKIGYLWFNLIGCAAVVLLAPCVELALRSRAR